MTMTRPEEWKGSDLRSRTDVVRYLRQHGGEVTDQTGLVVGTMRQELGKGRALSQLLADMEADGMLEREVRGRRTFRVTLKDDWGLVPNVVALPDPPPTTAEGADLDQLAHALLAITLRRASAPPPAPVPDKGLIARLASAENDLKHAIAERDEANRQLVDRDEQIRRLTHNLGVLQAQLDKRPTGPTVAERLSDEELGLLAQLQRELPVTPTSKPRRR